MVDLMKETRAMNKLRKETLERMKQTGGSAAIAKLMYAKRFDLREVAGEFTRARETLSSVASRMDELTQAVSAYRAALLGMTGYSVEECAKENDEPLDVATDSQKFEKRLAEIAAEEDPLARRKMCIATNNVIDRAIESWKSKADKMKERLTLEGSTEAEKETMRRKEVEFSFVVRQLQTRGETITKMFHDAKRAVEQTMERQSKRFIAIYTPNKETI